jgi:ankyrin repeat protein
MLRGKIDRVREHLDSDPALIHQRFPDFDFGSTGYRRLTLRGATLLHVAAEYGNIAAAELLLDKGADVNAPAEVDGAGVGGQTPLFHAVTQFYDWGLDVAKLLVKRGADLRVRARVPGHYEKPNAVVECTPFGYARMFPGNENETVTFLRGQDAPE